MRKSDWKKFKPLRDKALERFDLETFKKVDEIIHQEEKGTRQRYFDLYDLVKERDKMISKLFNHFSRSQAVNDLAHYCDLNLIGDEELETLSEETQEEVRRYLNFWNSRE